MFREILTEKDEIKALQKELAKNTKYPSNNLLSAIAGVVKKYGFTDVEVKGKGQGAGTTFWNDNDESIAYGDNIDAPSIYIDAEINLSREIVEEIIKVTKSLAKARKISYDTIQFTL